MDWAQALELAKEGRKVVAWTTQQQALIQGKDEQMGN